MQFDKKHSCIILGQKSADTPSSIEHSRASITAGGGEVQVDKKAAAERLIMSAITMVERSDDPLAIHVVAMSALNMLRELLEASGSGYVERVLRHGIYEIAKMRISGEIYPWPVSANVSNNVENVMIGIIRGEVNQELDLEVTLRSRECLSFLDYIVKPYNFLKHADRDAHESLDESIIDPDAAIGHALTAFGFICPEKPLPDQIKAYLEMRGFLKPSQR